VLCRAQQPQIILLREGTDTSQGKAQLISNINACMAVVDTVRTTLGPRGMDKLIHDDKVRRGCCGRKFHWHAFQLPACFDDCAPASNASVPQLFLCGVQGRVTISNDGATIMKLLEIVHPAAKVLVDISASQDAEVIRFARSPAQAWAWSSYQRGPTLKGHAAAACQLGLSPVTAPSPLYMGPMHVSRPGADWEHDVGKHRCTCGHMQAHAHAGA